MNEEDLVLRNLTYARFVELGRAPTAAEMAGVTGRERAEVLSAWETGPSSTGSGSPETSGACPVSLMVRASAAPG